MNVKNNLNKFPLTMYYNEVKLFLNLWFIQTLNNN